MQAHDAAQQRRVRAQHRVVNARQPVRQHAQLVTRCRKRCLGRNRERERERERER